MRVLLGCAISLLCAAPAFAQAKSNTALFIQQVQPDSKQFCYFDGQPYSLGTPYPMFDVKGRDGGPMFCEPSVSAINGATILEWTDRRQ